MILQRANRDIASEIKRTDGVWTKERYKQIYKSLKNTAKSLEDSLESILDPEEIIRAELTAQKNLMAEYGGLVDMTLPSVEQVMTVATFAPVAGRNFQNMANVFSAQFIEAWDTQLRTGYLTGMTTDEIVRRVIGSTTTTGIIDSGTIATLRNSINAYTRTALQTFATETRNKIYVKNSGLFSGYKYLATLDRRTCIVCGHYDGKVFSSLKDAPEIPLHLNCRCLLVPEIKGMTDSYDGMRASEGGEVKASVTFGSWLKEQSADVQLDVLGRYRYNLYTKGEKIDSFVADNRVMTIDELKSKS